MLSRESVTSTMHLRPLLETKSVRCIEDALPPMRCWGICPATYLAPYLDD